MVVDFICFSLFTSELKFVFVACVWHMLTGPDLTFCDGPVEKHIQFPERTLHSSFETVYILWSFFFFFFAPYFEACRYLHIISVDHTYRLVWF